MLSLRDRLTLVTWLADHPERLSGAMREIFARVLEIDPALLESRNLRALGLSSVFETEDDD